MIVTIGGTETVPYTTGASTGVTVLLGSDRSVVRNHQRTVSTIKTGDYYISTDCDLTAFPSDQIWGSVYDGMISSPKPYYAVKDDGSDCQLRSGRDANPVLFQIQDVSISGKEYKRALLLWGLHADAPFGALDFKGKEEELGITLPTASETNDMEVDELTILGYRKGLLANGQVSDFDGKTLQSFLELVAISRDRP